MTHVVIIGGGPGGYEAALVAAQLGADVTVVERDGLGGSTVLTDCVPSKTLIASPFVRSEARGGTRLEVGLSASVGTDLQDVNARIKRLALAQSGDLSDQLGREGVRVLAGRGRLDGSSTVAAELHDGGSERLRADVILVATGAHPRVVDTAVPDGERILNWEQVYDLPELPEHLIVIGSGVTGAEFAGAYHELGSQVTLVSSRDRVLPGEDADAAAVLEEVFTRRGMNVLSRTRMGSVARAGDGVTVTLSDGRTVEGSHCLLALGSVPNTHGFGLEASGVTLDRGGYIKVDKVSRTSERGVYAAGDCTGVLMLASVAGMQGRIAMSHALGDAVHPLRLDSVASNVFTTPEIATVGVTQQAVDDEVIQAESIMLDLAGNARAKMQGVRDGFVKLFCRPGSGSIIGGVVVAPHASEHIHALSLAVSCGLTVDQVASTFTVYPSISGSIAEAARRMHKRV